MFARQVTMQLKPEGQANFAHTIEADVIPLLRQQGGFTDEITFVLPNHKTAVAISLWDQKASADAYEHGAYPKVLKALDAIVEGTPRVETYEVTNSTFHKLTGGTRA